MEITIPKIIVATSVVIGTAAASNTVLEWVHDRAEQLLPGKPEAKVKSRRLRIWRREKACSKAAPDSPETKEKQKRILGPTMRNVEPMEYDRALEEEIFELSWGEAPLENRELVWVCNASNEWTIQTSFLTGGEEHVAVISPTLAAGLGFLDETGAVQLAHRGRAPRFSFGYRVPSNKIQALKLSIAGKEITCGALVKEMTSLSADAPAAYVVLPSASVLCMDKENVRDSVINTLLDDPLNKIMASRPVGGSEGEERSAMLAF